MFNKKSVKQFYKSQHYSARFIGFDNCFIYHKDTPLIKGAVIVSKIEKINFLHALVVASNQQQKGIGSTLVMYCKRNFDNLICFADLNLKNFYLRLGFSIVNDEALNLSLLARWQSYQKKNPNLLIFSFKKNNE